MTGCARTIFQTNLKGYVSMLFVHPTLAIYADLLIIQIALLCVNSLLYKFYYFRVKGGKSMVLKYLCVTSFFLVASCTFLAIMYHHYTYDYPLFVHLMAFTLPSVAILVACLYLDKIGWAAYRLQRKERISSPIRPQLVKYPYTSVGMIQLVIAFTSYLY